MSALGVRNLYLVAPMFSGKSKISREYLVPKMCRDIFEMDDEIEKAAGMKIPEIFAKFEEAGFRDRESAVLRTAAAQSNLIVSTGGGVVKRPSNIGLMRNTGLVVWIDVALPVLIARREKKKVEDGNRPLAVNLEQLWKERRPLYRTAAHFTVRVDSEMPADEIGAKILEAISWQ